VDVATAYNGQLHDKAIVDIVTERLHPGVAFDALSGPQTIVVHTASSDLYLATMFIHQSDRRRYGKLSEELENSFTKGNDDYPDNLVSAYHLINEYKCWKPTSSTPESSGVAFAQKGKGKQDKSKDEWQKKATCHNCGEIGHIRPNCPKLQENEDNNNDDKDSSSTKPKENSTASDNKPKKKTSFAQCRTTTASDTDTEGDNEQTSFVNFGFCTTSSKKTDLRNMILLDNQSTVDLFCNPSLVSRIWESQDSMTVHGNGGTLTTTTKALIKNYGEVWFHKDAITNILSLKNVSKKFRVTYDSAGTGIFTVHKPNGIHTLFHMHPDGLHYHDTDNRQLSMVSTVTKQSEGYSKKQVQ
jgi:hypothetical protein